MSLQVNLSNIYMINGPKSGFCNMYFYFFKSYEITANTLFLLVQKKNFCNKKNITEHFAV